MNRRNRRKILAGSLFLSLFCHTLALCFFHRYSQWISTLKISPQTTLSRAIEKADKTEILKETFQKNGMVFAQATSSPKKQIEPEILNAEEPRLQTARETFSPPFQLPFPEQQLLAATHLSLQFTSPNAEPFNLLPFLPQNLKTIQVSNTQKVEYQPTEIASAIPFHPAVPAVPYPSQKPNSFSTPLCSTPLTEESIPKQALQPHSIPYLPKLPTLSELNTVSYSDEFEVDLLFLPKENEEGYLFALTLIPHPDIELPKLQQHFTFLIDKSNSIQQDRLQATKNAIRSALHEIQPEDTFNILAFDSKVEKLSPTPLSANSKTISQAEAFLEKIQLGSFFSSSDPCKPLFSTIPNFVNPNELYTAILLTDGESLSKKGMNRALFAEWTVYNSGRTSLFTLGLTSDNHLPTLDATTVFNQGKQFVSSSKRGLKRKLLKLVKSIQHPIAKNLTSKAISRSPQTEVTLYSSPLQANHLYLDQPYVILGEVSSLDDFILFIQGQLSDRWINIKKTVSFLHGRKGAKSLKSQAALHQAYRHYEQYLLDANLDHIAEARTLLQPYNLQVAFQ